MTRANRTYGPALLHDFAFYLHHLDLCSHYDRRQLGAQAECMAFYDVRDWEE